MKSDRLLLISGRCPVLDDVRVGFEQCSVFSVWNVDRLFLVRIKPTMTVFVTIVLCLEEHACMLMAAETVVVGRAAANDSSKMASDYPLWLDRR